MKYTMQMQQQNESQQRTAQIEEIKRKQQLNQTEERPDKTKEIEEAKKKPGGAL
jgi:hypothetical protein